jgi:hypothetical protein
MRCLADALTVQPVGQESEWSTSHLALMIVRVRCDRNRPVGVKVSDDGQKCYHCRFLDIPCKHHTRAALM